MSSVAFDIGNYNSVIAVARNRGIDVVINEVSNRATPTVVSFGSKQRFLGEPAKTMELSNFKNTVGSLKRLLGRQMSEIDIKVEQKYLNCDLVAMEDGSVGVKVMYQDEVKQFSATQLMAMYLGKLKQTAENDTSGTVTDVVVSIPTYYTEAQRRALVDAAQIAGLNVLRLMPDVSAAALQWGLPKSDLPEPDQGIKYVAFVDVGQSDTTVSIVGYQKGKMMVKGIGYDRHLGGRNFDDVLVDYFVKDIQDKYKMDASTNAKALFRLRTACERTKKVLSANNQSPLNIECLMNDKDVSALIQRNQFEKLIEPLIERLNAPLIRALEVAGIEKKDIECVEIVGGCTRIPSVKAKISQFFAKEISTTLNQDECVAKGCAFMCAILSPVFRTKDFKVEDLSAFPVKLCYDQPSKTGQSEYKEMVAFASYTPLPNTKLLTFTRRDDFELTAAYSDESVVPQGASLQIGKFKVTGVKPKDDEPVTIKVKVRLNSSGILEVNHASVHEEVEYTDTVKVEPTKDKAVKEEPKVKNAKDSDEAMDVDVKESLPTPPSEPATETVTKKKILKKELPVSVLSASLDGKTINTLREAEVSMWSNDKLVKDTEERRNSLEEYVYELRGKMEAEYADYAVPDVKASFMTMLEETESWLYGEGEDATKSVYVNKLEELQKIGSPIATRYKEAEERPAAIDGLRNAIKEQSALAQSTDSKYEHIEQADRDKVLKECNSVQDWLEAQLKKQESLPKHQNPAVTVVEIIKKRHELVALGHSVMSKAAPKKEVPKEEPKTTDGKTAEAEKKSSPMEEDAKPEAKSEMDLD